MTICPPSSALLIIIDLFWPSYSKLMSPLQLNFVFLSDFKLSLLIISMSDWINSWTYGETEWKLGSQLDDGLKGKWSWFKVTKRLLLSFRQMWYRNMKWLTAKQWSNKTDREGQDLNTRGLRAYYMTGHSSATISNQQQVWDMGQIRQHRSKTVGTLNTKTRTWHKPWQYPP